MYTLFCCGGRKAELPFLNPASPTSDGNKRGHLRAVAGTRLEILSRFFLWDSRLKHSHSAEGL